MEIQCCGNEHKKLTSLYQTDFYQEFRPRNKTIFDLKGVEVLSRIVFTLRKDFKKKAEKVPYFPTSSFWLLDQVFLFDVQDFFLSIDKIVKHYVGPEADQYASNETIVALNDYDFNTPVENLEKILTNSFDLHLELKNAIKDLDKKYYWASFKWNKDKALCELKDFETKKTNELEARMRAFLETVPKAESASAIFKVADIGEISNIARKEREGKKTPDIRQAWRYHDIHAEVAEIMGRGYMNRGDNDLKMVLLKLHLIATDSINPKRQEELDKRAEHIKFRERWLADYQKAYKSAFFLKRKVQLYEEVKEQESLLRMAKKTRLEHELINFAQRAKAKELFNEIADAILKRGPKPPTPVKDLVEFMEGPALTTEELTAPSPFERKFKDPV